MNSMNNHNSTNGSRRLYSLLVALILICAFAAVFYRNLLRKAPERTVDLSLNEDMEKRIIEELNNDKDAPGLGDKKPDSYTFYKTLTDAKKPEMDPVAELLRKDADETKVKVNVKKDKAAAEVLQEPLPNSPGVDSKAKYYIQLASFSNFEKADSFMRDLKVKGYRPFMLASEKESKSLYRVRLGSFESRDQALSESRNINDSEKINSIVVKE